MSPAGGDLLDSRRGAAAVSAAVALLFLAPRLALLFARDPFFDEIFTLWISARPWHAIVEALWHDSGPPLYYFLAGPLAATGSVVVVRVLSLIAATIAFALVLAKRSLGPARFTAAALLAVHPAAVLFSVDARAYALCALLVLIGILLIEARRPILAAAVLAAAAYSHYYAVLFFPALLLRGRRGVGALALAVLLFAPGFLLAAGQPPEAMGWSAAQKPFDALGALLFFGRYPAALFVQGSWIPVGIALLAFAIAAAARTWRYALYVAIPVAGAMVFALAGRNVYFPMRFESVVAAPLALWMATSLHELDRRVRITAVGTLVLTALIVLLHGTIEHFERPIDPYRRAAYVARALTQPQEPIVASGYCYLETVVIAPSARAFPEEQATHPGWRAAAMPLVLQKDAASLPPTFVWVGERLAPELQVLREQRRGTPLFVSERALVVRFTR